MWPFTRKLERTNSAPLFFTNTESGKKEVFVPLKQGAATLYSCGPTVYSPQHIGNMRAAVFADLVGRVLKSAGYRVRRVINITDVGHLLGDNEGDADQGEDRIEKAAREAGLRADQIAEKYTEQYLDDIRALGVDTEDILFPRATEYVKEQIALIEKLEAKNFTYRISDGIYFDTGKLPRYGRLGGIPKEYIVHGTKDSLESRIDLVVRGRIRKNQEKRNPGDFALWKFSPKEGRRQQEWQSPWGRGFPGWHLECSAMSKALLGESIDVHTGGIEHIPVHHNNEIAQSEAASGKQFVRYWMHLAHLNLEGAKFSKSEGRVVLLSEIIERGYHPLSLRYFFLQAHYKKPLSFSWEALAAASEALTRLWKHAREIQAYSKGIASSSAERDRLIALLRDDLSTPQALAILWEAVKDENMDPKAAWGVIEAADKVLGLSLASPPESPELRLHDLPLAVQSLIAEREVARKTRDFARADQLRIQIAESGYHVEDRPDGPVVTRSRG